MVRTLVVSGFALAALGLVAGCGGTRPPSGAPAPPGREARTTAADVDRFRDALESHGQWIDLDSYGTVWAPLGVRADWRPYADGRWIYTELGWLWLGDEPWAWAVYHYGRWLEDPDHGWVWVPSSTWGSAWVAWRRGKGWVGWAPLPPDARWTADAGLSMDPKELDKAIPGRSWSFVSARDFTSSKLRGRIAPIGRNTTLLSLTMNVTRYAVSGSRPAERGMTAEGVGLGGRPPRPIRVTTARAPRINRAEIVSSGAVEVYRPEAIRGTPGRVPSYSSGRAAGPTIQELRARDLREQMKLDQALRTERDRLGREQDKETRTPPPGVSTDALKRRHENEIKAQARFEDELREQAARRKEWLAGR
jgi:hypothetical protein